MPQTAIHPDNDTPSASDAGIKRMDKDTPFHPVSPSTATPRPTEDQPNS